MILVPNVGAIEFLEVILEGIQPYFHLYTNDPPLDLDTVLSDFVQATYPGYAAQLATGWTEPEIESRRAYSQADPLLFQRGTGSPSEDCFGYYVTRGITGGLLWCERFDQPPKPMRVSTDTITIQPVFTDRGERRRLTTGN